MPAKKKTAKPQVGNFPNRKPQQEKRPRKATPEYIPPVPFDRMNAMLRATAKHALRLTEARQRALLAVPVQRPSLDDGTIDAEMAMEIHLALKTFYGRMLEAKFGKPAKVSRADLVKTQSICTLMEWPPADPPITIQEAIQAVHARFGDRAARCHADDIDSAERTFRNRRKLLERANPIVEPDLLLVGRAYLLIMRVRRMGHDTVARMGLARKAKRK